MVDIRKLLPVVMGKKATFDSYIIPALGTELYSNPGMEGSFSSGLATGWTKAGTPTVSEENTIVHGGSKSQKIIGAGNQHGVYSNKSGPPNAGNWVQVYGYGYKDAASSGDFEINVNLSGTDLAFDVPSAEWKKCYRIGRHNSDTTGLWARQKGTTQAIGYFDDASLKVITLPSAFGTKKFTTSTGDVIAIAQINVNSYSQIGFWINVDDVTNPQNGVLCYVDGANVYLDKLVSGTYSNVFSVASVWTNGDELKCKKIGTSYVVYKNGLALTTKTISDATVKDNVNHAQFSTYELNKFIDFKIKDITALTLKKISVIGNSIGASVTGFTAYLSGKYNYGYTTLTNHAVAGAQIHDAGGTDMADQVTASASDAADIIIVELGTNDSTDTGTSTIYSNGLAALRSTNASARIYCMGILPSTNGTAQTNGVVDAINAVIQAAAIANGCTYLDTAGWIIPATDTADGLHPNASGSIKIANRLVSLI